MLPLIYYFAHTELEVDGVGDRIAARENEAGLAFTLPASRGRSGSRGSFRLGSNAGQRQGEACGNLTTKDPVYSRYY